MPLGWSRTAEERAGSAVYELLVRTTSTFRNRPSYRSGKSASHTKYFGVLLLHRICPQSIGTSTKKSTLSALRSVCSEGSKRRHPYGVGGAEQETYGVVRKDARKERHLGHFLFFFLFTDGASVEGKLEVLAPASASQVSNSLPQNGQAFEIP